MSQLEREFSVAKNALQLQKSQRSLDKRKNEANKEVNSKLAFHPISCLVLLPIHYASATYEPNLVLVMLEYPNSLQKC